MFYNKRQLYLVVDEMEFCITAPPDRIYILEEFLLELRVSKNAANYTLNEYEFIAFQEKLVNFFNQPSSKKNLKSSLKIYF